jgi:outer membrane lipoprotein-sorting protein
LVVTKRGDLYDLIDRAPVGLHSLRASLWKWTHHERSARAMERLSNGRGVVHLATVAGPIGDTNDEHLRVWLVPPGKWCIESEDRIDVRDGSTRWFGRTQHVTELADKDTDLNQTDLGIMIEPGTHLMGAIHFDDPTEDEIDGRKCWRTNARTADEVRENHHHRFMLSMRLGGIDHQFWFDAETGIVLRHVGLIDDQPCTIAEFTGVTVNQPIPDETFQFVPGPGGVVQRQVDQLIEIAENQGVDLTDVDRSDPRAVQAALSAAMRFGPQTGSLLESRQARHIPVGPPPEDEATARAAIEYAYSHFDETDDQNEALVNVQGHPAWIEALQQARRRIPGSPDGDPRIVVDDIKFLRPDEAVVWFSVEIDGTRLGFVSGREGRAVVVDGRWMIEHAALADLLTMAGVTIPPPSD